MNITRFLNAQAVGWETFLTNIFENAVGSEILFYERVRPNFLGYELAVSTTTAYPILNSSIAQASTRDNVL